MNQEPELNHSVSIYLEGLKSGDEVAATELWKRYFEKVTQFARRRLGNASRRVADEEDVALAVFQELCDGAHRGRFKRLTDRNDLWQVMVMITRKKAIDQVRKQTRAKRGSGQVSGESVWQPVEAIVGGRGIEQVAGESPTPDYLCCLDEQHRKLIDLLPDETLRQVASLRLESFTTEEIGQQLQVSTRTIERKLATIRELWQKSLEDETV